MDILKDQAYEKELNKTRFKAIPAVFAVIEKDGCILLGKRADTGYMAGKYGLVSGHVDGGEPLKQAMIREIEEEVGLIVKAEDLDFVHISHRVSEEKDGTERMDFFFYIKDWVGEPAIMEKEKVINFSCWPADDRVVRK